MEGRLPLKEGGDFSLKIGNRWCSLYDYGKHLLRMLNNAITPEDIKDKYTFYSKTVIGVRVIEPFDKLYDFKDFPNIMDNIIFHRGEFDTTENVVYQYITKWSYTFEDMMEFYNKGYAPEVFLKKRR